MLPIVSSVFIPVLLPLSKITHKLRRPDGGGRRWEEVGGGGRRWHGSGKNPFNLGADPNHASDPGIFFFLLSLTL